MTAKMMFYIWAGMAVLSGVAGFKDLAFYSAIIIANAWLIAARFEELS